MIVFRIGKLKWKEDLTGEGAKKFGGRWNHIGVACIYTSESRALAVLEYSSHTPLDLIPRGLGFTLYEIPEDKVYNCEKAELPGDRRNLTHTKSCKDFGTKMLLDNLVIKLPSVTLPYEHNYILNPSNPSFSRHIHIHSTEDYAYDLRIKK